MSWTCLIMHKALTDFTRIYFENSKRFLKIWTYSFLWFLLISLFRWSITFFFLFFFYWQTWLPTTFFLLLPYIWALPFLFDIVLPSELNSNSKIQIQNIRSEFQGSWISLVSSMSENAGVINQKGKNSTSQFAKHNCLLHP